MGKRRSDAVESILVGIGVPDKEEDRGIPVTFMVNGRPTVVYAQDLSYANVWHSDGRHLEPDEEMIAIEAVQSINAIVGYWQLCKEELVMRGLRYERTAGQLIREATISFTQNITTLTNRLMTERQRLSPTRCHNLGRR